MRAVRIRRGLIGWTVLCSVILGGDWSQAQDDLVLRVQGPETELTTGSEFTASVLFDTQLDGVQGWSFGVAHDPAVLELLGAELGSTTATVNNGAEPGFIVLDPNPPVGSGVVFAVVINLTQPIFLDAGDGYELLRMDYRVVGDPAQSDPCEPIESSLAFSEELGDPPVDTLMTVDGDSREPTTVDDSFTVRCPGSIEFTRCEGDTENVYLEWAFGGPPEWDFLFLYRDGEFREMLEIDDTSFTDEGLEAGDYEYTLATFVVEDPATPVLIFAFCTATIIPVTIDTVEPAIGHYLGGTELTVTGTAFTTIAETSLAFRGEGEEPLPLEVLEVRSETELLAVTPRSPRLGVYDLHIENERGAADLPAAFEYGFTRGEVNEDGTVDMSDAIQLLNFLYTGTAAEPACLDAADTTDDGNLDLSDAIRILGFLFLGNQPPEEPFEFVGQDPTADDLGCLDSPPAP